MIVRWVMAAAAALMLSAGAFASEPLVVRTEAHASEPGQHSVGAVAKAETKKKKIPVKKPDPPKAKESYQLPMKVVVVRSSEAGCEPNCPEWIQAEGEIKPGSAAEFRKVFKQTGKRKLPVLIRSPGGSMEAALEIGRMIRKRGLDVAVGYTIYTGCAPHDKACKLPKEQKGVYRGRPSEFYSFCTSACPLILAAGTNRVAGRSTYVGVHQVRTTWVQQRIYYREKYRMVNGKKKVLERKEVSRKTVKSFEKAGMDKRLRKTLTSYLKDMGIGLGVLEDMERASPQDMYRLLDARMKELKLVAGNLSIVTLTNAKSCNSANSQGNCSSSAASGSIEPARQENERRPSLPKANHMTFMVVRLADQSCEPLCPQWIAAEGEITRESPQELRALLGKLGKLQLPLIFNSRGGDPYSAMEMGRLIRARNLRVGFSDTHFTDCAAPQDDCASKLFKLGYVHGRIDGPGMCGGACILALAGGERRFNNPSGTAYIARLDELAGKKAEGLENALKKYFYEIGEFNMGNKLIFLMKNEGANSTAAELTETQMFTLRISNLDKTPYDIVSSGVCRDVGPPRQCVNLSYSATQ